MIFVYFSVHAFEMTFQAKEEKDMAALSASLAQDKAKLLVGNHPSMLIFVSKIMICYFSLALLSLIFCLLTLSENASRLMSSFRFFLVLAVYYVVVIEVNLHTQSTLSIVCCYLIVVWANPYG